MPNTAMGSERTARLAVVIALGLSNSEMLAVIERDWAALCRRHMASVSEQELFGGGSG